MNVNRLILVAPLLFVCIGCGDSEGRRRVYPVRGSVTFEGKSLEGALIVFVPVEDEPDFPRPTGSVEPDGSFEMTTYREGDGAPEGEYKVSITWRPEGEAPETGGLLSRDAPPSSQPDPTGGRYADFESSGLTATVETGSNELPPFVLE